jgi:hypothetical protein
VLQSLRGHEGSILALAFDSERILSVGGDNTIRYWRWGKRTAIHDKCHLLEEGETLTSVTKRYNITIDNIMRWNGILDLKKVHPGMKLIVKKGDPNQLTSAEKIASERDKRRVNTRTRFNQNNNLPLAKKYSSRVQKLATDIDTFSLGNRMFGQATKELELFSIDDNSDEDKFSLGARIRYDIEMNDGGESRQKGKDHRRYYLAAGNEDEWGEAADALGNTMLELMVELIAYEVVFEQKKQLRDKQSVIGRMFLNEQKEKSEQEQQQALLAGATNSEIMDNGLTLPVILSASKAKRKVKQREKRRQKSKSRSPAGRTNEDEEMFHAIHHSAHEDTEEVREMPILLNRDVSRHYESGDLEIAQEDDKQHVIFSLPPIV